MKSRNKGFTLLEAVLALSVLTLISGLFLPTIKVLEKSEVLEQRHQWTEWHIFLLQFRKILDQTTLVKVEGNRLFLEESKKSKKEIVTTIEQYHQLLRRVKNGGHEPLLTKVEQITFKVINQQKLKVKVRFQDNEDYQAIFWLKQ